MHPNPAASGLFCMQENCRAWIQAGCVLFVYFLHVTLLYRKAETASQEKKEILPKKKSEADPGLGIDKQKYFA